MEKMVTELVAVPHYVIKGFTSVRGAKKVCRSKSRWCKDFRVPKLKVPSVSGHARDTAG